MERPCQITSVVLARSCQ